MPTPGQKQVFLSTVSKEFRSYRLKLANQLGALQGQPFEVKVQEDFQQGGFTLLEKLADYIRDCDLVIHLVGGMAGARPSPEHERTLLCHLGEADTAPLPGWSYTQWEYQLARRYKKQVLSYIADPTAPRDCGLPVEQSDEDAQLQLRHRDVIDRSGEHWKSFAKHDQFVSEVFFDLGLDPKYKVSNLPFRTLGTLFKGRDEFLQQIRAALGPVDHRGHQRVAAITAATAATVHGLGGIGKTRAAIEFAHRFADDYTALLFVTADSPDSLQQNLAALCGPLVLDLAEQSAKELEVQVAAVLRWLRQHAGWLLIFDNVDTDDAARAVESLLGQLQSAGQVLVTSRLSRWSGAVETLALDVLTEADAAAFLLERTIGRRRKAPDDETQARTLAVGLGQLALALEQAGAYIAQRQISLAGYLKEWRERHDRVIEWFNEREMQYPRSVAVTWQTSFDQLTPHARELLNRLAWFAPDPIPESLLETLPDDTPQAQDDLRDALADLERYSLATKSTEAESFVVHRLVQDVTRRSLADDHKHFALTAALNWIDTAFVGDPQDVRSWPVLESLAPHARTVAEHADQVGIAEPTARLMNELGLMLKSTNRLAEAEPPMRRQLEIFLKFTQRTGHQHPQLNAALGNYVGLLKSTGLSDAEVRQRLAELLAEYEMSLG